jgi:hypothetical protein
MAEVKILTKNEYLVGHLNEDVQPLVDMVLEKYHEGKKFYEHCPFSDPEDRAIALDFSTQIQSIADQLIAEWKKAFDQDIVLCKPMHDPNVRKGHAYEIWGIVNEHNQGLQKHTHESKNNYELGAHVAATFAIKVPENSGNFIFHVDQNPYIPKNVIEKPEVNKFIMFDATTPHFVTANQSDELRMIISMNFRFEKGTSVFQQGHSDQN